MLPDGYIWNQKWTFKYESAYGLAEKFKYANAISGTAFSLLCKRRHSERLPNKEPSRKMLHIYSRYPNVSADAFLRFFNLDKSHFNLLNVLGNNTREYYLRSQLYFCPKCMNLGYHSYLHQLTFIDQCPFHNTKLLPAKKLNTDNESVDLYLINIKSRYAYDGIALGNLAVSPVNCVHDLVNSGWENQDFIKEINLPYKAIKILPINLNPYDYCINELSYNGSASINIFDYYPNAKVFLQNLYNNKANEHKPIISLKFKDCSRNLNDIISEAAETMANDIDNIKLINKKFELLNKAEIQEIAEYWFYSMYIDEQINFLKEPSQRSIGVYDKYRLLINEKIDKIMNFLSYGSVSNENITFIENVSSAVALNKVINKNGNLYDLATKYVLKHPSRKKKITEFDGDAKFSGLFGKEDMNEILVNIFIYKNLIEFIASKIEAIILNHKNLNEKMKDKLLYNIRISIPFYIICATEDRYDIYSF